MYKGKMMKFSINENVNCCSTITANPHSCCTPQPEVEKECPHCHNKAKGVLKKTLNALLKDETKASLKFLEGFFYCKTPSCDVIYFRNDTLLYQKDLKVTVGIKTGATPANLCYCFGWTKEKIEDEIKHTGKTKALDDIKNKMKDIGCSCEIKNPSGNCCLIDVKRFITQTKEKL